MFYVCQSCGVYNLRNQICDNCECTNLKSAVFSGGKQNADLVCSTHRLWSNNLYRYVCGHPDFVVAPLLFGTNSPGLISMTNVIQERFRQRSWIGLDDNIDTAKTIFPTPAVTAQLKLQEQRALELKKQNEEAARKLKELEDRIPAWLHAIKNKPVCLSYGPDFDGTVIVFEFTVTKIVSDKQQVDITCRMAKQDMLTQTMGTFINIKRISISYVSRTSADDLFFAALQRYDKSYADPNRLSLGYF